MLRINYSLFCFIDNKIIIHHITGMSPSTNKKFTMYKGKPTYMYEFVSIKY